jgi:glycosyltransferase involved in cell wall biosynthesis
MLKVSIITINKNNASGLQKTMESVFSQTSDEFEYIVIDGSSTDESIRTIQQFNDSRLKQFRWLSEPDTGIYNAMNKGIKMAQGEYVQFLNSGDWLADSSIIEKILKELDNKECDILAGNKISIRTDGKIRIEQNTREVTLLTFYRSTIHHTSAYIRRVLFEKYGLYDESLRIVSDWKWYLTVAGLNKADVSFCNINVSYFDTTGISSSDRTLEKAERRKVLEELVPHPILTDYDNHYFDIDQMGRIKKVPLLYLFFWFIERCLFQIEKWNMKYWKWKRL